MEYSRFTDLNNLEKLLCLYNSVDPFVFTEKS